ncbi:MAG: serine hydrolase domain-containing protein, partial [Verrucomicrobiota bacterium]
RFDDPLSQHLPEIQWPGVTIRHLLHHTSGAPDYMSAGKDFSAESPMTISDVVRFASRVEPLFAANEKHQYSNTGYVLLAGVIERVSGQTLESYTTKRLFEPLGMTHTRVWHLTSENPDFPMGLGTFSGNKWIHPGPLDGLAGDGGFFSNLDDFLLWERALRPGGGFFSEDLLKEAFQSGKLSSGKRFGYGFGWVMAKPGQWHNGAWLGARTYLYRNPGKGQLLIILDNGGNSADFIASDLQEQVLGVGK